MIARLQLRGLAAAALILGLSLTSGCASDPAYKNGSMLDEAGSAFMEGFLPTRVQLQRAATYPGFVAGQALAR